MPIKRLIIFAAIILGTLSATAQQFALVPPRNVVQGRNFALVFRLTDGEANPPAAPALDGCTLLYGPATSTMQSTQIINGKMSSSSSIDYSFTYRADTPGTVEVPEVAVSCNGSTLRSRKASFQILPTDQPSQSNQQGQQAAPRADDPTTQTPGNVSADDLLVRISFSKSSVYEQEPVVATIKVYTKYDITSFMPTTQPAFEGFLCEELPVTLETQMEHYNGQNYHTAVLKRLLLYPQKSGKLTVNSGRYDITIVQYEMVNMGFFRTQRPIEKQITTSSNAAALIVKALPEPRPAGFSGAVGHFTASAMLQPELMRTNEASVYSYTVKGQGNIKYLSEPGVQFPAGIDAYTPKTDINANITGGGSNMSGTFRTDYTIVPQEVGNFTIAGVPFIYFNPESGKYETAAVDDMPIKVLKGNTAAPAVQQSAIDNSIKDILHIKPIDSERRRHNVEYTFFKTFYWLAYLIVALIFLAVVVLYRRHIRLQADVTGRKLAKAGRVATKRLREANAAMKAHDTDKFYTAITSALQGYISDKLVIPASQLTRDNIAEKLTAYGLPKSDTDVLIDVLDTCAMARFTPEHSDAEIAEVYQKASTVIKSIEDVKKH